MEKDKSNIKLTQKLEKVRHNKRKLEKFVEKKMEVIEQISEQRLELQKSLDEARINDLIRNGRYKCPLQELETLKKENLNKLSDFGQQNIQLREELEKFKSENNVLGWLLASKGALPDTNNRQEEQKLEKETSRDEEEKEEEEKQKEEKIAKTTRKPIVFDLEPEKPKSSHITFQGEKVRATTTRDCGLTGLDQDNQLVKEAAPLRSRWFGMSVKDNLQLLLIINLASLISRGVPASFRSNEEEEDAGGEKASSSKESTGSRRSVGEKEVQQVPMVEELGKELGNVLV
ncbi:M protein, serotype 2.1-like [Palaemon carinicauda]|uniref:M protein, serotype 2.1-like n=1 Tax=Palaemon carinicauda TaxID=392227 RepID=UPI0035B5DD05